MAPQRDLILMEREIPLLKGSAKRWGLAIKFLTAGFMIKNWGWTRLQARTKPF
ncbi:hypothetical protein M5E88_15980 [Akkermansia muciniphila]|nr:hypothetical protein M5E88_15980 [Akkermansia muciniphila]